jgi:hypothetical protein
MSVIIGLTAVAGFGGVSYAQPAKHKSILSHFSTVCTNGSWQPVNKTLYVEADCPSGAVALGGGPVGDPGNEFDSTLKASSGPLLDSNNQQVGWTYTSIRADSGLSDLQFESIVVTVCVECAE